jgi:hypothetical protein
VQFLEDTIDAIGDKMVSLTERELRTVVSNASAFDFDFDDAYQYSVAEKYDFTLISFDTGRSVLRRQSPDKTPEKCEGLSRESGVGSEQPTNHFGLRIPCLELNKSEITYQI